MKLLLINPRHPESHWTFTWTFRNVIRRRKFTNPPLGLATIAALTPRGWEVTIVDENVEPIDWSFNADIVGVGGMSVQFERQREILLEFRRRGRFVVAGGSFALLCPERYEGLADTVVSGEAEYVWPRFCRDFLEGCPRSLYREDGEVDVRDSPTPRFDLITFDHYVAGTMQFSRGCPFRCEFCDIIIMFGRKPRTKCLEQVARELDMLRAHGVRNIILVDDNLIGSLTEARRLLDFLGDYQEKHDYPFAFGTEASINLAHHPTLLKAFKRAGFSWVFIGIESPDEEALVETKKAQNTRTDLVKAVRTVYSNGIDVFGGFIVGFDADDKTIFDRQYRFIVETGIVNAMVGMLMASPRTPLYDRLKKAGRLVGESPAEQSLINAGAATNIVPLQMSREELVDGCHNLHRRLLRDEIIYRRIANKMRYLEDPRNYGFSTGEWVSIGVRLLVLGILPGGPTRWAYFLRSLVIAARRPQQLSARLCNVIANWSYALALRDYTARCLARPREETRLELLGGEREPIRRSQEHLLSWRQREPE